MRFNASSRHAAFDALEEAVSDDLLRDISEDVVPVVRCLAILGGTLKIMQRRIRDEHQQDEARRSQNPLMRTEVPLSLASLWLDFT